MLASAVAGPAAEPLIEQAVDDSHVIVAVQSHVSYFATQTLDTVLKHAALAFAAPSRAGPEDDIDT